MSKFYSKSAAGFFDDDLHVTIPSDAVVVTDAAYAALFAAQAAGKAIQSDSTGAPVVGESSPPTTAQVVAALNAAVQAHLDAQAKALRYDNILAAISYAEEPAEPKFQAEGVALRAWRSAVWVTANIVLNAVAAGEVAPTASDLVSSLPKFTAPA